MDCIDCDSDMDISEVVELNVLRIMVILFIMVKIEIFYLDGQIEIVRNIIIFYLDNVDFDNFDFFDIVMEILIEVFNYFNNWDVKVI